MKLEPQGKATQTEALLQLYHTVNGPSKAGPKWVTYRRETVDAMLDVLKQILVLSGCDFRGENHREIEE